MPSSMVIWNGQFWFVSSYWDGKISRIRHFVHAYVIPYIYVRLNVDILNSKWRRNNLVKRVKFNTPDNQTQSSQLRGVLVRLFIITFHTINV